MPSVVEEPRSWSTGRTCADVADGPHAGQRQFRDEVKLRDYYRGKGGGKTDAELDALFEKRFHYQKTYAAANMREIVALATNIKFRSPATMIRRRKISLTAIQDRVSVAEFPTTMEAARGLHQAGIGILMGAPNVVRGGSHSGNIAAIDLRPRGIVGYPVVRLHPLQPVDGRAAIARHVPAIDLASARPHRDKTPAEAVGLADRGEIAPGKRADLIRCMSPATFRWCAASWREGQRVA